MRGAKLVYVEGNGHGQQEHRVIVERVLGRALHKDVHVHHVDLNKSNNANTNLVVCPDAFYHQLLHIRTRALDACGNPDWRKCRFCKQWDSTDNLYTRGAGHRTHCHRRCAADYMLKLRQEKRNRNPVTLLDRLTRKRNTVSGLPGVSPHGERFQARMCVNGKSRQIGTFPTKEMAHAAYVEAKLKLNERK